MAERPQTAEGGSQKNMFTTKKDKPLLDQHIWKTRMIQEKVQSRKIKASNLKAITVGTTWIFSLQEGFKTFFKGMKCRFLWRPKILKLSFCQGKVGKVGKDGKTTLRIRENVGLWSAQIWMS